MKYLNALAGIPSARLVLGVALIGVMLVLVENLPWFQSIVEFLLNMNGAI
jgi:hypothetical protein